MFRCRQVALWLFAALLLAACASQAAPPLAVAPTAEPTPKPTSGRAVGRTLRILYWQAPEHLNPHLSLNSKELDPSRITYEPLASFDKDGNLVPFLAAEIPSLQNGDVAPDGRSVTWRLKRGVRWSDGRPFSAADVHFTYQYATNPAVRADSAGAYADVADVRVLDDYTVRVIFKDVNPSWALPFVGAQGMILPRHVFEQHNNAAARRAPANLRPVGTGPYRVAEFKTEEVLFLGTELIQTIKIIFEPNPYFREPDKPFFRRVEFKGGGTASEATRSVLQTGDVDFAWNTSVDAVTLEQLQALGKGRVLPNLVPYVERIQLNRTDPNRATDDGEVSSVRLAHPFFSDLRVRRAFAYAIDRGAIAELYPGSRIATNNLVSPPVYASANTRYEFDPDRARALLDEAGWADHDGDGWRDKDGVTMRVVFRTTANNPLRQRMQELVRDMLWQIGVDVSLDIVDSNAFFSDDPHNLNSFRHFRADMQEFSDGNLSPDPGSFMKYWLCSSIPQKANNWTGENAERWCDPRYDALYMRSLREIDPKKRAELFIQMNDMLIDDIVMIPLVHTADLYSASNKLAGVDLTPWDAGVWNIKDWRLAAP
jgi:peptide/nickel transport system substrate-binding protein